MFKQMNCVKVMILSLLFTAVAAAGPGGDNGAGNNGDMLAYQFYGTATSTLNALKMLPTVATCQIQGQFAKAISSTKVESQPTVYDGMIEKDARNFSDSAGSNIIVSRVRWLGMDGLAKVRLALHEYLTIAGVESSDQYGMTDNCTKELTFLGVDLSQLVPNLNIVTDQVIRAFSEEKAHLSCFTESDDGQRAINEYIVRYKQAHYTMYPGTAYQTGYQSSQWLMNNLRLRVTAGGVTSGYDLQSGETVSTMNFNIFNPHGDAKGRLSVSSRDGVTWEATVDGKPKFLERHYGLTPGSRLKCKTILKN